MKPKKDSFNSDMQRGMGGYIVALAIILFIIFCICANGQTIFTNKELAGQMQEIVKLQQAELDDALSHLADSRQTAQALGNELALAQGQMNKVGQERDGWKKSAQELAIKLAVAQKHVAYLIVALTALIVAIGVYLFLKLWLHLPI